jgi:hypothetical protein
MHYLEEPLELFSPASLQHKLLHPELFEFDDEECTKEDDPFKECMDVEE